MSDTEAWIDIYKQYGSDPHVSHYGYLVLCCYTDSRRVAQSVGLLGGHLYHEIWQNEPPRTCTLGQSRCTVSYHLRTGTKTIEATIAAIIDALFPPYGTILDDDDIWYDRGLHGVTIRLHVDKGSPITFGALSFAEGGIGNAFDGRLRTLDSKDPNLTNITICKFINDINAFLSRSNAMTEGIGLTRSFVKEALTYVDRELWGLCAFLSEQLK